MANNFRSNLPTFRCYTYLAGTCLAIGYIVSYSYDIGMLQACGIEVVCLVAKYYLSPYIIQAQYWAFNNAKEVEKGDIFEAANAVKEAIGVDKWKEVKVYLYESHEPNAFAVGLTSNTAAVYVSSALSEKIQYYKSNNASAPETSKMLEGVIAHEFGHITGRHAIIGCLSRSLLIMIDGIEASLSQKEKCTKKEDGREECEPGKSFDAARYAASLFKFFGLSAVSRQNEYMADNFAVSLDYGDALKHSLMAIHSKTEEKLKNPDNMGYSIVSWFAELYESHPSLKNRVIAIAETQAEKNAKHTATEQTESYYDVAKQYFDNARHVIYTETMSHFRGVDATTGQVLGG